MNAESMNPSGKATPNPLIRVRHLTFSYEDTGGKEAGGSPTLSDLSFSVAAGEIFGFLGPSGAGKSTTQKILYRLLHRYQGEVYVDGRDLRSWNSSIYARIGIGFETPNLYTRLTGRENLLFTAALRGFPLETDRLDEAVARLGLTDAIDTRVETWSKGMRMRLAFIRAVLHRPPILFLDEPTSGLDPHWARRIKDWILELRNGGSGIFITTHAMELADELCDSVGFLVEGRLVAIDAPASLKKRFGRPGIVVTGSDENGDHRTANLEYRDLLDGPVRGFSSISRVVNREVNLEQVFLTVTGHRLDRAAGAGSLP